MSQARRGLFRTALTGVAVGSAGWLVGRLPLPVEGPERWWPWLVAGGAAIVLGAAVVAVRRALARLLLCGSGLVVFGVWFSSAEVPIGTPGRGYWVDAVVVGAAVVGVLLLRELLLRGVSAGVIGRWSRRSRRNSGVASFWQVWRTSSAWAARRKARTLRPSLASLSWWARRWTPIRELATPLARVGLLRVWSPIEDVTLRVGGPRVGKTGELAGRILDAPGAVIATSTRTDLIDITSGCRSGKGPLYVFNPSGLGRLDSTITFDPLAGCDQPKAATARATDLLAAVSAPGQDAGDREFWGGQARRVLAALLHAAALGGGSMRDVLAWVADPDAAAGSVSRFLRRSPEPAFESDAAQFLGTNDRTRSSICATVMPALGWLTDATAAAAASGGGFVVGDLLSERGTVYMLGAEDAQVAPLVTALTGHIAREARKIAARKPGGRLDPPLTLVLDEAALICPIPLDQWTADMGGRNVTIHIGAQSRAQLRQRWGDTGAAAIMNNAATLLIYGGTRDSDDLNAYSALTGERDEKVDTFDLSGDRTTSTTRRVPVLSAGQIAQLPAKRVVVIRRGMPPAVGRVRMAWDRRDVKAEQARQRAAVRREAWAVRVADFIAARDSALARVVAWWDERLWQLNLWLERHHRPDTTDTIDTVDAVDLVPAPRGELVDAIPTDLPADLPPVVDAVPVDDAPEGSDGRWL